MYEGQGNRAMTRASHLQSFCTRRCYGRCTHTHIQAHLWFGSGSQGHEGHPGHAAAQVPQPPVSWPAHAIRKFGQCQPLVTWACACCEKKDERWSQGA
eukprot:scaffold138768_cov19-Tisochrysis_lutea.AAC.1